MKKRLMALLLAATLVIQGMTTAPAFAAVTTGDEFTVTAANPNVTLAEGEEVTLEVNVTAPEGSELTYVWADAYGNPCESTTSAYTIVGSPELSDMYFCDVTCGDTTLYATFQVNYLNIVGEITLATPVSYTFTGFWQDVYFKFVPTETRRYAFTAEGEVGMSPTLYDADMTYIESVSGTSTGFDFLTSTKLIAGNTYYIGVNNYYTQGTTTIYADDAKFTATTENNEVTVLYGEANKANLVVDINNEHTGSAFSVVWSYAKDAESEYTALDNAVTTATGSTYTVNGVPSAAGLYKCTVSLVKGGKTVDTKTVDFTVTVDTQLNAYAVGSQVVYGFAGDEITLEVEATSLAEDSLKYKWWYYDADWNEVTVKSATGSSYTFNLNENSGSSYYCTVEDACTDTMVSFDLNILDGTYELGNTITLPVDMLYTYGAQRIYKFVPTTTGTFAFTSDADGAYPEMIIKDANGEYLSDDANNALMGGTSNTVEPWWNENADCNMYCFAHLEEGETYYLTFRLNGAAEDAEEVVINVTDDTDLSKCAITVADSTYDGTAQKPAVTVKFGRYTLKENVDYTLSYTNTLFGKGTVTVSPAEGSIFTGSVEKDFVVKSISINDAKVTLSKTSYVYDGTAKKPSVTVKLGDATLTANDYTVSYSKNVAAGIASVTITGKNGYTGKVTKTFKIAAATITKNNVTVSSVYYNGKAQKTKVVVKVGKKTLKEGTDYTLTYSNNKNIGTAAKVVIKGKGNYAGTVTKTFTIKPKKGTTFKAGAYKYTITSSTTVAFAGRNSKTTTTVKVADTVTIGGKKFKVTSIADKALYKTNVKKVTIGKNVTTIGKQAFEGCTKLTTVSIGAKVTTIKDKAFKSCTALKSITIPANVKTIGKEVFYGAKKLKTITVKSTKITSVGKNAFKNINSKATIKVPSKKYSTYVKKTFKGKGQAKTVKIKK